MKRVYILIFPLLCVVLEIEAVLTDKITDIDFYQALFSYVENTVHCDKKYKQANELVNSLDKPHSCHPETIAEILTNVTIDPSIEFKVCTVNSELSCKEFYEN